MDLTRAKTPVVAGFLLLLHIATFGVACALSAVKAGLMGRRKPGVRAALPGGGDEGTLSALLRAGGADGGPGAGPGGGSCSRTGSGSAKGWCNLWADADAYDYQARPRAGTV